MEICYQNYHKRNPNALSADFNLHKHYKRPLLARLWEYSQSGGQNNKIFLHKNRSQFPQEKISFVLSSGLAAFPRCAEGVYSKQ